MQQASVLDHVYHFDISIQLLMYLKMPSEAL